MDESLLKSALNELKADLHKYPLVCALAAGYTLTDALKKINRSKTWFYNIPEDEQDRLIEIAADMKAKPLILAKQILDDAVVEASRVKVSGLTNRDPRIQQSSSTEIIDRAFGKTEQSVSGEVNIVVTIKENDRVQNTD